MSVSGGKGVGSHRLLPNAAPATPGANANPTPLADAVASRAQRTWEAPFHVPGHKRGSVIPPPLHRLNLGPALQADLTELEGLDVLGSPAPGGVIAEAQQLAAEAWGAQSTWFLVNGSTAGVHAAVMATCAGDVSTHTSTALVIARNAHISAFHAMILAKCTPIYVGPETCHDLGHNVTPEALESGFREALDRGLTPKAALVVSPTYFGVTSDISGLVRVCEKFEAMLIVDEAHGAHLDFLPHPYCLLSALHQGAHLVVQSTHKQLAAFTQGGMLHLGQTPWTAQDLQRRISQVLSILQTTSPSYLIMASLDAARAQAQDPAVIQAAQDAADCIHSWLLDYSKSCPHGTAAFEQLQNTGDASIGRIDPWRFTLMLSEQSINQRCRQFTGWEAAALLEREYGVVAECASRGAIVFAVGIGTTMEHAKQLTRGLKGLHDHLQSMQSVDPSINTLSKKQHGNRGVESKVSVPLLSPWTAFLASQDSSEIVDIKHASGRISAEMLCPYPPGIPIVYPGEIIHSDMVKELLLVLQGGGRIVGAADPTLKSVRVLQREEEKKEKKIGDVNGMVQGV